MQLSCMSQTSSLQSNLLDPNQSGFKSCPYNESALLSVIETLQSVRGVFSLPSLQFSSCQQPFTQWTTQKLLSTWSEVCITGKLQLRFKSYLTERSFKAAMERSPSIILFPLGYRKDLYLVPYYSQYAPPPLVWLCTYNFSFSHWSYLGLSLPPIRQPDCLTTDLSLPQWYFKICLTSLLEIPASPSV